MWLDALQEYAQPASMGMFLAVVRTSSDFGIPVKLPYTSAAKGLAGFASGRGMLLGAG